MQTTTKRRKVQSLLLTVLLLATVGCTVVGKSIDPPRDQYSLLGRAVPNELRISYSFNLVNSYRVYEGEEYWINNDNLSAWRPVTLHRNTERFGIMLNIANPDKHYYKVYQWLQLKHPEKQQLSGGYKLLYKGRLSRNSLVIPLSTAQGVNGRVRIHVVDVKNRTLFSIGEIKYSHKEKEVVPLQSH